MFEKFIESLESLEAHKRTREVRQNGRAKIIACQTVEYMRECHQQRILTCPLFVVIINKII